MNVLITPKLLTALGLGAKEWRIAWDKSISDNFRAGGRPSWAKTLRGGSILQQTGRLRNSIRTTEEQVGEAKWNFIAGVNGLKYARIHQYGGVITAKGEYLTIPLTKEALSKPATKVAWNNKLFRPKGKNALCISDGKGGVIAQYALKKSVLIKARPYLVIQPEDEKLLKMIILEKVREAK